MANNIVLIGMRGSGKTTVSAILSEKTGYPVVDSDYEITAAEGIPIKDMVAAHGWEYFREKETIFLEKLSVPGPFILSTGGGMPVSEKNRKLLKALGSVYYLFAKPEVLTARIIEPGDNRAIMTNAKTFLEDQQKVFEERKNIYMEFADHVIHTEMISPEVVAETIMAYYTLVHENEYNR